MRVLLVEDDAEMVEFISIAFDVGWPGIELLSTHQGHQGIEFTESKSPDIVILDLGLPDMSGFEVLKQIRAFTNVPIIIETVRNTETDIVKGLNLGADEYIRKPFGQLELLAKMKAVLRRQCVADIAGTIILGKLRLDSFSKQLFIGNEAIPLTPIEILIMRCLMTNHGNIVSHIDMSEAIWGDSTINSSDSIRIYIHRIRKKIEAVSGDARLIISKPGMGYLLQMPH